MAISTRSPAPDATISPLDSFAFLIDDTYTTVVIKVRTNTSLESAYATVDGGAQAGYTVSVLDNGDGTHTFTVSRDAGFDQDPTPINVVEDESGSSVTTAWSYVLASTDSYPQSSEPYDGTADGVLDPNAIHDNTASEISAITSETSVAGDHFLFEDASDGNAKKRGDVTQLIGGSDTIIAIDGVTASTAGLKLDFLAPLIATEGTADEFTVTHGSQNHSLTSHGSNGTCEMLVQFDGTAVDETSNHTFAATNTPRFSAGYIPGTLSLYEPDAASFYATDSGTEHQKGSGDTFSVYGMFFEGLWNDTINNTPRMIFSGIDGGGGTVHYQLYRSGPELFYHDSEDGAFTVSNTTLPIDQWFHLGMTRDASNVVRIYLNGKLIKTTGARDAPAANASAIFAVGSAGVLANSYAQWGHAQSIKLVNAVLTDAEMLSECKRMFGK